MSADQLTRTDRRIDSPSLSLLGEDAVLLPLPKGEKGPRRKGWTKVTLAETRTPEFQAELRPAI